MFAKGCVLAAADGHGLSQTVAQLVIECLSMLKHFCHYFLMLKFISAWIACLEPTL
jgi:hypothetical protein